MAAIRSGLVMLGRRSCGSSGSTSAAVSLGGRGLEIYQAFHPAAPRTPPPSLRPPRHYLENWRRFSTQGSRPTDKFEGVLPKWWQRWRNHKDDNDIVDIIRSVARISRVSKVGSGILLAGSSIYALKEM